MKNRKYTLEDLIVENLQKGPMNATALIELIKQQRPRTTKQGVYRTIRELKKEGSVVFYKKTASLHYPWIEKMKRFFDTAQKNYGGMSVPQDFLSLEQCERITYRFKSSYTLDQFWGHAFAILSDLLPKAAPVMIYNPHEWFMIVRQESERDLFHRLRDAKKYVFLTAQGRSPLDAMIAREFDDDHLQYTFGEDLGLKENYYLNVIGEYIIEVSLDPKIQALIEDFYQKTNHVNQESVVELTRIVERVGTHKLVLSRNKKKADVFRRRFKKNFYIPKECRPYFAV